MPDTAQTGARLAGAGQRIVWTQRLYLRVYLAVIASLLLAVLLFGWWAQMHSEHGRFGPSLEPFAEMAANVLPPASSSLQEQKKALTHLQTQIHASLSLYNANGEVLISVGRPLPAQPGWQPTQAASSWLPGRPPVFALKLPDGRWLLGQRMRPPHRPPMMGMVHGLLIAALAIAIGAYPVVRRLTRRLERLQASVDAWGNGQLSTRVAVEGKDEVGALAHSFNQAATRIETLVNAQKSLLANASHELRSPLARIRMALELLPPDQAGAQAAGHSAVQQELTRNIHELDQLIDEILLTSRLDATQPSASHKEQIDCIGLLAEECARVGAQLELAPDLQEVAFFGEAKLVRRMLRNLLENARRYGVAPQTAAITLPSATMAPGMLADGDMENDDICAYLRVLPAQQQIEIDICDRGPGVPEAQREQIFAPFYRLPGAREAEGGVGLGLALVRQIAERHDGSVQCLARDGGGSCFRLRLPLTPASTPGPDKPADAPASARG